jgi:prolipoprotein diacylglyceryltransferase
MLPTFSVFGLILNTYGVLVSLALLGGIAWALLRVRARALPVEPFVDVIFATIVAGLAGSRLGYFLEHSWDVLDLG